MRDFKKYQIWQQAFELSIDCYRLANQLPEREKFGLRSQINGAAISIPSNIT
jgi:four helix bundle protein